MPELATTTHDDGSRRVCQRHAGRSDNLIILVVAIIRLVKYNIFTNYSTEKSLACSSFAGDVGLHFRKELSQK